MKKKSSNRHATRRYILKALYLWSMTGALQSEIEDQFIEKSDAMDYDYFVETTSYITSNYSQLGENYKKYLDRSIEHLDPIVEAVLRLASYELIINVTLPYKVVLNEALKLSKEFGSEDSHKFVNGVLDKLAREVRQDEQ